MSSTDSTVLIFKCIGSFIKDLNDCFGTEQKSLLLYAHLVENTGIIHEEPIRKHIRCFHDFVKANEDAIMTKDFDACTEPFIRYSDKVFIDMTDVFKRADASEKEVIWKHLVTILAVLDPSSQAKKMLQEEQEKKKSKGEKGNEEEFLTNIINKVGSQIDPSTANPAEMMTNLMSSGIFTELVDNMNQGLTKGDLDLGKMIGSLQSMMGNLNTMVASAQQQQQPPSSS
jgi:hypothetical protein